VHGWITFGGFGVCNYFLPSVSYTPPCHTDSSCLTLGDNFKPTGISSARPTFLGRRGTSEGLPVNVDKSLVHWAHPSNSLEGKAHVLMNYSYFRKVNLDPHQGGNILAGLGLHNNVHGQICGCWWICTMDSLGPESSADSPGLQEKLRRKGHKWLKDSLQSG